VGILKVTHWLGAHAELPGGGRDPGVYLSILGDGRRFSGLDKVASADRYTPVTRDYIERELPAAIKPGNVYVLDTALGAGEAWGSNINADWFGEDMLKAGKETFVTRAHPFFHHVNHDPAGSKGVVLFAAYNEAMRRVELVVQLGRAGGGEIVESIAAGNYPRTSMGFRAEFDECSICGNQAYTRAQYCKHLRFEPNKIYPDGRKAYAINTKGYFFDHSYVIVPADRTAGTMVILKVASTDARLRDNVLGADVAAEIGVVDPGEKQLNLFLDKTAAASERAMSLLDVGVIQPAIESWPMLSDEAVTKLASIPMDVALQSSMVAGVALHPADFQFIALARGNDQEATKLAHALRANGQCFSDRPAPVGVWNMDGERATPEAVAFTLRELGGRTWHPWSMAKWATPTGATMHPWRSPVAVKLASLYTKYISGWAAGAGRAHLYASDKVKRTLASIDKVAGHDLSQRSAALSGLTSVIVKRAAGYPRRDVLRELEFKCPLLVSSLSQIDLRKLASDDRLMLTLAPRELDTVELLAVESILGRSHVA
jgi:hypothetical protein